MFDIYIECCRKKGLHYYIENADVYTDNNLQEWVLDSLSKSNMGKYRSDKSNDMDKLNP